MPKFTVKELVLATTLIALGLAFNTALIPPRRQAAANTSILSSTYWITGLAGIGAIIGARLAPSGRKLIGAGIGAGIVVVPSALVVAFAY